MRKTITSVVALGIMGTTSLAQEAGKAVPQKANAATEKKGSILPGAKSAQVERIDGNAAVKTAQSAKVPMTKPVATPNTKSNNPGIKPARQAPDNNAPKGK